MTKVSRFLNSKNEFISISLISSLICVSLYCNGNLPLILPAILSTLKGSKPFAYRFYRSKFLSFSILTIGECLTWKKSLSYLIDLNSFRSINHYKKFAIILIIKSIIQLASRTSLRLDLNLLWKDLKYFLLHCSR